ncbi:hypothetical protein AB0E83_08170 [Streptomyces sp. NPDC035033]|uniref:hypothetical protein n=1 Tax=Streptomyces sp. NPDC035033 TaxID=3155368 RepID=UPI0033DB6808
MTTTITRNTKRRWAARAALAALLAGTTACTSGGDDRAAAPQRPAAGGITAPAACADGTYDWFDIAQRDVLTGVAEKQTLGEGGGRLTNPVRRLHTPRTAVTTETGPAVHAAAALRSLGARVGGGEDGAFAEAGRRAPGLDDSRTDVDGPGTLVDYAYVREVVAGFRHTCPGGAVSTGRAVGWTVAGTGVLDCGEPAETLEDSGPAQAAARLSCGPDDPASKA